MIGVYGGTFDPVHFGHLRTALELKTLFSLAEVRLIPCANPPHRAAPLTPARLRLQMLQLAIANHAGLMADGCEINRTGPSYTVDTLRELRLTQGNTPILLFMGMDAFVSLERWHQWQQIFDYAHVVVITRPGFDLPSDLGSKQEKLANQLTDLHQSPAGHLFFQPVTQLAISATAIRVLLGGGGDPSFLLPDIVLDFIRQHQLYQTTPANTATL